MDKILLTSAGGLVGTYLIKHFKNTRDCQIIALDTSEIVPAKKLADYFYVVPRIDDPSYLATVRQLIALHDIDVVIPVASHDVGFFTRLGEIDGRKMLLIHEDLNEVLSNKQTSYEYLTSLGIGCPAIYGKMSEIVYPCIMKPRVSSGSRRVIKCDGPADIQYYSSKYSDLLFVEYIAGIEYTVDCLFDWDGKCLGYNVRQRYKTVSGGAVISINNVNEDVTAIIKILEDTGSIVGPVNFQYKRDAAGDAIVFDFNTRLPSGGLPLTVKSGFDIPNLMVEMLLGRSVRSWVVDRSLNDLKMVRFYEEMYWV